MAAPDSTVVGTRRRRAERARTEHADDPADALSGTEAATWRDWANLMDGPAGLIAERVLADDVASYLRFRAACVTWRRSTLSPHAHDILDRRFHPRRWIMLPKVSGTGQLNRRDFLNVSTGERIRVDLPELRDHFVLRHTSDGLILLCQKDTRAVCLLNPLTRQLTALPNATSIKSQWRTSTRLRELMESQAFSAGLADSSTLALHFGIYELAVAKPNAERWSCCAQLGNYTYSTLSFENRFYCFTRKGLMVVDLTGAGQRPQLVVAVKVDENFFQQGSQDCNLVNNGGELILVRRTYVPNKYEVYSVDLDAGKMVPMLGLHGRALFVCHLDCGYGRAISVQAGLSSSISGDTVYECFEGGVGADCRPRIDTYDLWRGDLIKINFHDHRGSILDYLARYVCRLKDDVVPSRSVGTDVAGPLKRKRKLRPTQC